MNPNQKEMIANLVKKGRLAKGFTQKELSEHSNISIRSIQRVENGALVPRTYTLKTLASVLDLPFESFQNDMEAEKTREPISTINSRTGKIILSAGISIVIILLAAAYLAQSASFPETGFELINFAIIIVLILTAVLLFIWRK